jgi:hypothetical protein
MDNILAYMVLLGMVITAMAVAYILLKGEESPCCKQPMEESYDAELDKIMYQCKGCKRQWI